jgi:hypothetical protein
VNGKTNFGPAEASNSTKVLETRKQELKGLEIATDLIGKATGEKKGILKPDLTVKMSMHNMQKVRNRKVKREYPNEEYKNDKRIYEKFDDNISVRGNSIKSKFTKNLSKDISERLYNIGAIETSTKLPVSRSINTTSLTSEPKQLKKSCQY